ncbi:MAG: hypothetical protein EPO68_10180 [Planctomycetota bacterium]|nr:MAG: hypothetical protein EPO68_10180 [Planctomycetota bacterium]
MLADDLLRPVAYLGRGNSATVARLDPELGFAMLVPGPGYNEFGTAHNSYAPELPRERARVVFLGDSVTRRGRIVKGLLELLPTAPIEWWNAGVESYNTEQEVGWYKRYVERLEPDLVVLTVHPNDLDGTTVMFVDAAGDMVRYRAGYPPLVVNGWLYRNSRLYRELTGVTTLGAARSGSPEAMQRTLVEFREYLAARGTELFLFVMPWTKAPERWNDWELGRFQIVRKVVAESGAPWCDGALELVECWNAGEPIDEMPGDTWHPSDELGRRFAQRLLDGMQASGVLDAVGARVRARGD